MIEISYSPLDLMMYLLIYSFLGWAAEVLCFSIRDKHFINRGYLNVPFALPYGITAVILIIVLPTMNENLLLQYVQCLIICGIIKRLTEHFVKGLHRENDPQETDASNYQKFFEHLITPLIALAYFIVYLLIHPLIFSLCQFIPMLMIKILVAVFIIVVAVDFACVLYAVHTHAVPSIAESSINTTRRLADKMRHSIRSRLEKNYPGILEEQNPVSSRYIFAEGLCLDKLLWVFLTSSFIGALFEMVYCRMITGEWMSRSGVLYGAFSFVWGFGAVILTITLQRLSDKPDRHIFAAGFLIGGTYEYLCSVILELIFGTTFWDYSNMPLNIGGRTNVMYCMVWGILSVVWLKILYPQMSKAIEKIPPLPGKILTWTIIVVMICDGILTAAAMGRYTDRQQNPEPQNVIEQFLDARYDDDWMENRWPNMVVTAN